MKRSIIIDKEDSNGYLIRNNPIKVIKNIFDIERDLRIEKENNEYCVFYDSKLLCKYSVTYEELYDYIINILYKGEEYHYYCDEENERLRLNLREYCYSNDGKNIRILDNGYGASAEITENDKGLAIDIEEKDIDISKFKEIINSLDFESPLNIIFNKLKLVCSNEDVKIKKYSKMNTIHYEEKVTDLLIIRNGILQNYLTSIDTNIFGKNMKYKLKKDIEGYSVSFNDDSIAAFRSSHFVLDEQMDFVHKLELKTKKKILSKNNK